MKKIILNAIVCLAVLLGASQFAFAHAHLLSSSPTADGTVKGPAISINLKFNSRVDSSRSHLDLVRSDGKVEALSVSAPGDAEMATHATLTPGRYTIRWQALSVDGHITRGEIPFTVQ